MIALLTVPPLVTTCVPDRLKTMEPTPVELSVIVPPVWEKLPATFIVLLAATEVKSSVPPLMVKCLARVSVALLTVLVERRRIVPEVKFISPVTDIAEVPLPFFMLKVPPARLKFPATEMVEVPELFTAVKVPALSLKFAPTVIVRLFEELVRNRVRVPVPEMFRLPAVVRLELISTSVTSGLLNVKCPNV